MHSTILSLAGLFSLASASVIPRQAAANSSCPFNYPTTLRDTTFSDNAFYLTVKSDTAAYDGHNVQLRTSSAGKQVAVIDSSSPVLAGQLSSGTFQSEAVSPDNEIYSLGVSGVLVNSTDVGDAQTQCFEFSNGTTASGPGQVNTRQGFYLSSLDNAGTYGLYHNVPDEIVNGWLICPVTNGTEAYYQLFYYNYQNNPGNLGECESIALQVRNTCC